MLRRSVPFRICVICAVHRQKWNIYGDNALESDCVNTCIDSLRWIPSKEFAVDTICQTYTRCKSNPNHPLQGTVLPKSNIAQRNSLCVWFTVCCSKTVCGNFRNMHVWVTSCPFVYPIVSTWPIYQPPCLCWLLRSCALGMKAGTGKAPHSQPPPLQKKFPQRQSCLSAHAPPRTSSSSRLSCTHTNTRSKIILWLLSPLEKHLLKPLRCWTTFQTSAMINRARLINCNHHRTLATHSH